MRLQGRGNYSYRRWTTKQNKAKPKQKQNNKQHPVEPLPATKVCYRGEATREGQLQLQEMDHKTKQNKAKQNKGKTKQNKTKQKTKQNKTKAKQNKAKQKKKQSKAIMRKPLPNL